MADLPIDPHLPSIRDAASQHGALVLIAPPGAGKTTRVPPSLLEAGEGQVLVLQPRRIAARGAAQRMADEWGCRVGQEVGYHVRFDKKQSSKTRILCLTNGMFLKYLQNDPSLEGISAVIFDEFHERHLDADLGLALVKECRSAIRDDLKVVVMSATLAGKKVADYLETKALIEVPGRQFPLSIQYLSQRDQTPWLPRLLRHIRHALDQDKGHVLVFLPGVGEIRRSAQALREIGISSQELHGELSLDNQADLLRPSKERKLILATNIAETSITIDGVGVVIDTGQMKRIRFDPRLGVDRLELREISRASADQRAGRAGRTGPGKVYRLWTEAEQASLEAHESPEVQRLNLTSCVLELKAWGIRDPEAFEWYETPPQAHLSLARTSLTWLGALESESGKITELGKRLLQWPIPPRLGRLLLEGEKQGCPQLTVLAAALCDSKDIVRRAGKDVDLPTGDCDLTFRLEAIQRGLKASYFDSRAIHQVQRTAAQLQRFIKPTAPSSNRPPEHRLRRCLLAAFPDRVARRRGQGKDTAVMVGGQGVRLSPISIVREARLFVAVQMTLGSKRGLDQAIVTWASAIEPEWLEELFPKRCHFVRDASFDETSGKVVGRTRWLFDDLVLEEKNGGKVSPELREQALEEAIRKNPERAWPKSPDLEAFLTRVAFLRRVMPELAWPTWDKESLLDRQVSLLPGCRSMEDIRKAPLLESLQSELSQRQRSSLAREAPDRLMLPKGRRARIEYSEGEIPILRARVQDLFGLVETPRFAAGRVPCLIELLAPNQRPVQRTQDLANFWKVTYAQVRKDLRGRYPKHDWPERPPGT